MTTAFTKTGLVLIAQGLKHYRPVWVTRVDVYGSDVCSTSIPTVKDLARWSSCRLMRLGMRRTAQCCVYPLPVPRSRGWYIMLDSALHVHNPPLGLHHTIGNAVGTLMPAT